MPEFVSFNQHRDRIHDARFGEEVDRRFAEADLRGAHIARLAAGGLGASKPARREAFATELDKVMGYLRGYYRADGASAHTFQNEHGDFVDCIPFDDLPTVRAARAAGHAQVATRAPAPRGFEPEPEKRGLERPPTPARLASPLRRGLVDRFGNRLACAEGCVPVVRLTPDDLTRAGSFGKFFEKEPGGAAGGSKAGKKGGGTKKAAAKPATRSRKGAAAAAAAAPVAPLAPSVAGTPGHRYANAVDTRASQYFGCSTGLTVWQPQAPRGTTSISQLWLLGSEQMSPRGPQSIESGWFVYDTISGTTAPVLFVFFNPDGYIRVGSPEFGRSGYVTNAMHQGFVPGPDPKFVVNQSGFLLPSTPGSDPAGIQLYWEFNGGTSPGWYLHYGDVGADPSTFDYLGYFPSFLFKDLQGNDHELVTHCARVEFGGEVGGFSESGPSPVPGFTQMGSGTRPSHTDMAFNYRNVGSQSETFVATSNGPMVRAKLQPFVVDTPSGFDLAISNDPAFASFFFFGGTMPL